MSFCPFKPMELSAHRHTHTHKSENILSDSFTPFIWQI